MFKRVVFILCAGMFFFSLAGLSYSQQKEENVNKEVTLQQQEVGNNICPVSGEEINEEIKATYEYKGKIYNLCCASCIKEFRNNPEKYVQIVEENSK